MTTIEMFQDGNRWCALLGEDLQVGLVGFGDTPVEALKELVACIEQEGWNF